MCDQLTSAASLNPVEIAAVHGAQRAKAEERRDLGKVCARCGTVAASSCARCKVTRYCSRNCQRLDWKQHKTVCDSKRAMRKSQEADAPEVD